MRSGNVKIGAHRFGPSFMIQAFSYDHDYSDGTYSYRSSGFSLERMALTLSLGLSYGMERRRHLLNRLVFPEYTESWDF